MGMIGESLAGRMKRLDKIAALQDSARSFQGMGLDPRAVKDIREHIEQGADPLHAAYVTMQHLTSMFAEGISMLPELKAYCDIVGPAEEDYMPQGPPWSPLTGSYFTCWAFFDLRFGPDKETIGTCFLEVNRELDFSPDMSEVLELMLNSRMGIYEHRGIRGGSVVLQELTSKEEYECYVPAGYAGETGQCWLVRRLPPVGELFDYSVVFTTPYVLTGQSKEDWIAFLNRTLLAGGETNHRTSLYEFMKYGLDTNYWNEYLFQAYQHHQKEAIFLSGLPDVQGSLPHGELRKGKPELPGRRKNRNQHLKLKKPRRK